uniref:Uncharacterized protein n=1 Tax=Spongospora subterranea TaxID=70186 RepID=A0A0H5RSX4_9EUKA|eukprot:CRZ11819.1 hypothetical protein [Spongospora subterranea]
MVSSVVSLCIQGSATALHALLALYSSRSLFTSKGPPSTLLSTTASLGAILYFTSSVETLTNSSSLMSTQPFLIVLIVLPMAIYDLTAVIALTSKQSKPSVPVQLACSILSASAVFTAQLCFLLQRAQIALIIVTTTLFSALVASIAVLFALRFRSTLIPERIAIGGLLATLSMFTSIILASSPPINAVSPSTLFASLPLFSISFLALTATVLYNAIEPAGHDNGQTKQTGHGIVVEVPSKVLVKEGEPSYTAERIDSGSEMFFVDADNIAPSRLRSSSLPQNLYSNGYISGSDDDGGDENPIEVNASELRAVIAAAEATLKRIDTKGKGAKAQDNFPGFKPAPGLGRMVPLTVALEPNS